MERDGHAPTRSFMAWNIETGGFGDWKTPEETPPRFADIVTGVNRQHPGFVAVIDAFRWHESFRQEELAGIFGYRTALSVKLQDDRLESDGYDTGYAILTDYDVESFRTVRLGNRNAVLTTLKEKNGLLDVFSVYLDDLNEDLRMNQIRDIVPHLTPGRRTLIIGDLNTVADRDLKTVQKTMKRVFENGPERIRTKFLPVTEKLSRRGVVRFLESIGFRDTADKPKPTVPTKRYSKLVPPLMRVDYAFSTPDIAVARSKVVRGAVYDRASDHYPILVEIVSE